MTFLMRILALLTCAALTATSARSESLSATDRETLLEKLDILRDATNARVDARFRLAMARYRAAMATDETALTFYLECVELVNFKSQQKKTSEFLDWKRQEDIKAKHSDSGFRLALRYQLNWLVLSLCASSEKANLKALGADAQDLVDAIFRDAEKLAGQEQELSQAVSSTVFARAYEIGNLQNDKWPTSPVQLDDFYQKIVFPPLRTSLRIDALRVAWIKRIHQEGVKIEFGWGNPNHRPNGNGKGKGDKPERKVNMAADIKGPEYERYLTETQPELQWQMEVDLFRSGDESASAMRMLAHIQKHITHKQARKWGEEFQHLLKPEPSLTEPEAPRK